MILSMIVGLIYLLILVLMHPFFKRQTIAGTFASFSLEGIFFLFLFAVKNNRNRNINISIYSKTCRHSFIHSFIMTSASNLCAFGFITRNEDIVYPVALQ